MQSQCQFLLIAGQLQLTKIGKCGLAQRNFNSSRSSSRGVCCSCFFTKKTRISFCVAQLLLLIYIAIFSHFSSPVSQLNLWCSLSQSVNRCVCRSVLLFSHKPKGKHIRELSGWAFWSSLNHYTFNVSCPLSFGGFSSSYTTKATSHSNNGQNNLDCC